MWTARRNYEASFSAAKRFAALGAGIAVLTWFLGFQVIGGAGVMMGQAEGLQAAIEGAFRFGSYIFLTLISLSQPELQTSGFVASAFHPKRTLDAKVRFRPIADII